MRALVLVAMLGASLVATTPAPADAAPVPGRCVQYEGLLAAHGMPVRTFSRIMFRESRCRPGAVNRRSGARGLLQIMPQHVTRWRSCPGLTVADLADADNPQLNIACAARLYRRSGTRPWASTR